MVASRKVAVCRHCSRVYSDVFGLRDNLCPDCAKRQAYLEARFGCRSPETSYWRRQPRFSLSCASEHELAPRSSIGGTLFTLVLACVAVMVAVLLLL